MVRCKGASASISACRKALRSAFALAASKSMAAAWRRS
jgi:hypothetical protein